MAYDQSKENLSRLTTEALRATDIRTALARAQITKEYLIDSVQKEARKIWEACASAIAEHDGLERQAVQKTLALAQVAATRPAEDLPGIGEVTAVVTPLASKMLSLGALLAAIERDLPVSYIEAGSYYIEAEGFESSGTNPEIAPVEVWLTGEPYEVTSSEHQTTS